MQGYTASQKNLSSDERKKAEHFSFERDKNQFIAARGILRLILACYLSAEPSAIEICSEKNGKPRLHNEFGKTGIQFNVSQSEKLALYTFTRGHEVGVDIEYMREISEMGQIVEQFFSAKERIVFGTLPASEKRETFFNWWTRKEAFTKATGNGLSYPLDMFNVLEAPSEPTQLLRILGDTKEGPKWSMWDVRPADEYAGAVVAEGEGWNVYCWQLKL